MSDEKIIRTGPDSARTCLDESAQLPLDDKHELYLGNRDDEVMRLAAQKILARVTAVVENARREGRDEAQIMTLHEGRDFKFSALGALMLRPPSVSSLIGLAAQVFLHLYEAGLHPFLEPVSGFKNAESRLMVRLSQKKNDATRTQTQDAESALAQAALGKAQAEAEQMIDRLGHVRNWIVWMTVRLHHQATHGQDYGQFDEIIHPTAEFNAFGDDWLGDMTYYFKKKGFKIHVDTQEFHVPVKGHGWSTLVTVTWSDNAQVPKRTLPKKPGGGLPGAAIL